MVLKGVYQFVILHSDILVGAHRFGVPFPKLHTFSEIFWALHIDYRKNDTSNFCLFVYLLYNDKSKFSFLETLQPSRNTSCLRTSHFCAKCRILDRIFLYTLEKMPWKNYV